MSRDLSLNGVWGEVCAARYLRDHKYEIISANYQTRLGELDIVAEKGKMLVFVEVKTRGVNALAQPAESVGRDKQRRLSFAAAQYMQQAHLQMPSRFDVIEVFLDEEGELRDIRHIINAFESQI